MKPTAFFLLVFLSMSADSMAQDAAAGNNEIDGSDVSGIISKANEATRTHLMHGDIKPSMHRNAVACTYYGCKWPKNGRYVYVPIHISSHYSSAERNVIIRALLTFHTSTCIRFVWRTSHRDYLFFYNGDGCWSSLGRQGSGQAISLKKNGCLYQSTIQHEVLHALGFHHEQVRSDRDKYVQILYQNIISGKEHNFQKTFTNNLGTTYDFNSVMHYSKYAFSKNGQATIVAKSNPSLNFGHTSDMSVNDIARVNRLYQCCE